MDEDATIDFVTALARLLSSQVLRVQFAESPGAVADQLRVCDQDRAIFVSLDAQQIDQQAATLLNKRWHEVRRLAPETIATLGDDAEEVFRYYASHDWPAGHQRHLLDAFEFLRFLSANAIGKPDRKELTRLRTHLSTQV